MRLILTGIETFILTGHFCMTKDEFDARVVLLDAKRFILFLINHIIKILGTLNLQIITT